MAPPIRYVRNADGLNIAYYALGDARPLIVLTPGLVQSIEGEWNIPVTRRIAEISSQNFTYIRFDPHGCGLSDRSSQDVSLDGYVHDLEAVADAAAPGRFALWAPGPMCPVAITYAAGHPDRVTHLVLWMSYAQGADVTSPQRDNLLELSMVDWRLATESWVRANDDWAHPELTSQFASMMRHSVTPETYIQFERSRDNWDVTALLSQITAPTLVLHAKDHHYFPTEAGQRVAAGIPGARLQLLEGSSVLFPDIKIAFITGEFLGVDTQRRDEAADLAQTGDTAIILFVDIAGSTQLTERLGDKAFRDRSRALDAAVREAVRASGGTPVEGKVMGDGVMSTFASARQAIDAALRCLEVSAQQEVPVHIGIHAGDVIREQANVYGGAVNISARICDASAPGEILVSDIVRGLARTSAAVTFEDRGEHALKGIEDSQRLFAVRAR